MVECRLLRLQAQILSVRFWMTEPEAEESPRYESADEGLASDFARLGLSSSIGQPVQPDSENWVGLETARHGFLLNLLGHLFWQIWNNTLHRRELLGEIVSRFGTTQCGAFPCVGIAKTGLDYTWG